MLYPYCFRVLILFRLIEFNWFYFRFLQNNTLYLEMWNCEIIFNYEALFHKKTPATGR